VPDYVEDWLGWIDLAKQAGRKRRHDFRFAAAPFAGQRGALFPASGVFGAWERTPGRRGPSP
jgi:hypothetical protein